MNESAQRRDTSGTLGASAAYLLARQSPATPFPRRRPEPLGKGSLEALGEALHLLGLGKIIVGPLVEGAPAGRHAVQNLQRKRSRQTRLRPFGFSIQRLACRINDVVPLLPSFHDSRSTSDPTFSRTIHKDDGPERPLLPMLKLGS